MLKKVHYKNGLLVKKTNKKSLVLRVQQRECSSCHLLRVSLLFLLPVHVLRLVSVCPGPASSFSDRLHLLPRLLIKI